jgi:hypothetical protein
VGGSIRFEGLVRPLQCTGTGPFDFTLNQEALRFDVRHGFLTQNAGTQPLPAGLPAEYFRDGPAVLTGAELRSAVGLSAGETADIELRVFRVGNTCGFPMDALGPVSTVGSLSVSLTGTEPPPPTTVATGAYDGTNTFDDGGIIVHPERWWLLPEGSQFYIMADSKSAPFNAAPPLFPFTACAAAPAHRCSGLFTLPTSGGQFQVVVTTGVGETLTWTGSVNGGVLNVVLQPCGQAVCTFNGTFAFPFP